MKISDAELEVMQVIWDKQIITSTIIINELKYKNWKDTTIRTLLTRLENKGAIEIIGRNRKFYVYKPKISEFNYQKEQLQHFINTVLRGDKNKLKLLGE